MGSPADVTYGPIFIGMVLNIMLYGVMLTQTYLYFDMYKRDKTWIKLFVLLLLVCDTLNSAFDISFVYIPLVANYGNTDALRFASWIFSTDPAMTAFIALLVQGFFACRVRALSNSRLMVLLIGVCSACQFLGGLATSIACRIVPEFVRFQKFSVVVIIWLSCSAAADILITVALVWHLRKHKTGLTCADDVVNRIIRMTVQTGMVTTVCAIIDLVLFLVTPTGLHLIFNLPLSKLYTNSLLSSLNSRKAWRLTSGAAAALPRSKDIHTASSVDEGWPGGTSAIFSSHVKPGRQPFADIDSYEMDVGCSTQNCSSATGQKQDVLALERASSACSPEEESVV